MKHSKIISVTIVLCLICAVTMAQSIGKSVVAANGGSFSGSGILVDWTIGQPVTNYVASSPYLVSEGFLPINDYSVVEATPMVKNVVNTLLVKAYPNPVSSVLHISVQQNTAEPLTMQMTDVVGKTVKTLSLDAQLNTDAQIDVSSLAAGMYYVTIYSDKENAQVMKIVKN